MLRFLRSLFHREDLVSESTLRHVNELNDRQEYLSQMESKGWRKAEKPRTDRPTSRYTEVA